MKHGLPETPEEGFEIRLKNIASAERALKRCYFLNDCWVTSEIDRALACLRVARAYVKKDKETFELVRGGKE